MNVSLITLYRLESWLTLGYRKEIKTTPPNDKQELIERMRKIGCEETISERGIYYYKFDDMWKYFNTYLKDSLDKKKITSIYKLYEEYTRAEIFSI